MSIYQNIKDIAKRKNIQQKDIAEAFGVTENTMTNYLTGRTKITAEQLPLFAKLLRVSIEDLFTEETQPKTYKGPEVKLDVAEDSGGCRLCAEKDKRILDKEEIIKGLNKQIAFLEFSLGKNKSAR